MLKSCYIRSSVCAKVFAGLFFIALVFSSETEGVKSVNSFAGVKKIVIDAGHGGKDSGCLGASAREKDVALSVALKLGKFIEENFKDVEVIYTRKTDIFLELHERANIANKHNADLFICIHANSGPSTASGTETYVMGLHKSEANLHVAKRENSSILMEDNYEAKYEGFDPNSDESYIALSLMQSAFLDQSLSFASKIQKQFEKLGRSNRGVKQAGFLVLYKTTMPSVLIETGFLTNKKEEEFLASTKNQEAMAGSIFSAFKEYKIEVDKVAAGLMEKPSNTEESKKEAEFDKNRDLYPKSDPNEKQNTVNKQNKTTSNNIAELVFKVQLMSSKNKIPLSPENFNGLKGIGEYEANGWLKYTYGEALEMDEALKLQEEAKAAGYKDAFLIAFYEGKKISVAEAQKIKESKK